MVVWLLIGGHSGLMVLIIKALVTQMMFSACYNTIFVKEFNYANKTAIITA